jgi:hypothetical protein
LHFPSCSFFEIAKKAILIPGHRPILLTTRFVTICDVIATT